MSIREEFEKAFDEWYWRERKPGEAERATALWAAEWMVERCAKAQKPLLRDMISRGKAADNCRQLAKELREGK